MALDRDDDDDDERAPGVVRTPDVVVRTHYAPPQPVDLRRTLQPLRRGRRDPATVLYDDGAWLALTTPLGAATLALTLTVDGVRASAWGDGAEWAIASVPDLLGASDDADGFDATLHPLVRRAAARFPGLRLTRSNRVLDALAPAIVEQEVTGVEALGGWRHLVSRFGSPAPAPADLSHGPPPRLTLAPTAQQWQAVPSWAFHEAGIAERRWRTVRGAAAVAHRLERTLRDGRGGPGTARLLMSLPGVGVWTAAYTMQVSHGDPDSPAYGDAHISRAVCWALARELLPAADADRRMAELLEPWAGQRERVVRLVLATGVEAPRRGHRMAPPPHRSW